MKKSKLLILLSSLALSAGVCAQVAPLKPVAGQGSAQALIGLPNDFTALEARGIVTLDNIASTSVLYSLQDMKEVPGAGDNLLESFLRYHQIKGTPYRIKILAERQKCADVSEVFARKDCLGNLMSSFSAYGKTIGKAEYLNLSGYSVTSWDDKRSQIDFKPLNLGSYPPLERCIPNAVCLPVGGYGAGNNLVCYQTGVELPSSLSIPMSESQARDLSRSTGGRGINDLKPSVFLKVTEPVKLLANAKMCTNSRGKILAEGKATMKYLVLWGSKKSEYLHDFQPGQNAVAAGPAAKGAIAPLAAVKVLPGVASPDANSKINLKVN